MTDLIVKSGVKEALADLRLEGFVTDKIPFWPAVGKDLKWAMRSAAAD